MTQNDDLKRIQEIALENAIEEMDAADALGVDSAKSRGDRGFLTGMAAKSLGVAVRIEQFLALRASKKASDGDDEDQEKEATGRMVNTARQEVAKIMERVGAGNKPRR